jgi:hypothetical protein
LTAFPLPFWLLSLAGEITAIGSLPNKLPTHKTIVIFLKDLVYLSRVLTGIVLSSAIDKNILSGRVSLMIQILRQTKAAFLTAFKRDFGCDA